MTESSSAPLSGRRAQAARNDERILESARAVFVADPGAPISTVAEQAGVGISALYRRYESKEELLRQLNRDSLADYIADVKAALADEGDPWESFADFMRRRVDADSHSLTLRLAGTFTPTEDLYREGERAQSLNVRLFERTQRAGAIRRRPRGRRPVLHLRADRRGARARSRTHPRPASSLPGPAAGGDPSRGRAAAARAAAQLARDRGTLGYLEG